MKIQSLPIINWFNPADQTAAEVMLNDFKALYGKPEWAKGGNVAHDDESIPAPLYFRIAHVISMMFLVQNIQMLLATLEAGTKEFQRMLNTTMRAQNQLHRAMRDLDAYYAKLYPKPKQGKGLSESCALPVEGLIDKLFPIDQFPRSAPVDLGQTPADKAKAKQMREWAAAEAVLAPAFADAGVEAGFLQKMIMPILKGEKGKGNDKGKGRK